MGCPLARPAVLALFSLGLQRLKSIAPAVEVYNRFTPLEQPREHQQMEAVAPPLQCLELALARGIPGQGGTSRDQAIELADRRLYSLVRDDHARAMRSLPKRRQTVPGGGKCRAAPRL